jgi:succinate-semialdehyde dehydrogenase/glutarate-semialdehyde dehydrogenase
MSAAEETPLLPPPLLSREPEISLRYRLARDAQVQWAGLSVRARARRLGEAADVLLERMEDLADLIVEENGKPRVEAYGHEIGPSAAHVRYMCALAPRLLVPRRFSPAVLPIRQVTVSPAPLGVVLIISPWNVPLAIPFGQALAALLAGNAVVLKPSEVTPRIGDAIGEVFAACGLPPNLFSVVQGDGRVGAELIAARPDKVLFTGSLATGRKVMAAAAVHPIPVSLELGGVDALVVCRDADVEFASSAIAFGSAFNHGQICASVERVLVHETLREELVSRVVDKLSQVPARDLGRVTTGIQRRVYDRHLRDARKRGLHIRCGGVWRDRDQLAPTIIEGEGIEDALVWREETFGPVVAVATFRHDHEAMKKHDDCAFGLTASVFTTSPERAEHYAGRLRVGAVSINELGATLHTCGEVPWGGVEGSGFGRSHGQEGLLECTRPLVVDRPRWGLPSFKRPWWFPYDPQQRALMADLARSVGHRSFRERLRARVRMGRTLLRQLVEHPRL